jgi:phage minor tail protein G
MFLKSELLESNGSSVTLFQLSALQRIEHLEYLKQMEAVEEGDFQAAITLTVKSVPGGDVALARPRTERLRRKRGGGSGKDSG